MQIIVDMNLSPRWIAYLAAEGFDARHWSDIGPADALDTIIMDHARSTGSVILTHDLDFGSILAATGGDGPSVVQIRAGDFPYRQSAHRSSPRSGKQPMNSQRARWSRSSPKECG